MICEAEPLIDTFDKFVLSHATRQESSLDGLLEKMAKIREFHAQACIDDSSLLITGLRTVIEKHVVNSISQKFPVLSPELFLKRRWVGVEYDAKANTAKVIGSRLSAPQEQATNVAWIEGNLLVGKGTTHLGAYHTPTRPQRYLTLRVEFPGSISVDEMDHAYAARAMAYRVVAELLENRQTSSVAKTLIEGGYHGKISTNAYWIPSLEGITVNSEPVPVKRDPALVMDFLGAKFLCCFWDAANEQPLEALIREFSTGGKVRKSRK